MYWHLLSFVGGALRDRTGHGEIPPATQPLADETEA